MGHLGHRAELARTLVPGHPKVRSSTVMAIRPVDAEAVVHPLEVEVHLLEDGVLGPVPVLVGSRKDFPETKEEKEEEEADD